MQIAIEPTPSNHKTFVAEIVAEPVKSKAFVDDDRGGQVAQGVAAIQGIKWRCRFCLPESFFPLFLPGIYFFFVN